jgi:serine/threonine protein kinase
MLTLVFAIWFGHELRHQSEVGAPLARSAADMNASINQSIAELRAWIAYGDSDARDERTRIWVDQIEPTMELLERLTLEEGHPKTNDLVNELGRDLRLLKLVQWEIEDVARTPGNEPATVAYEMNVQPLRRNIMQALHGAIEEYSLAGERRGSFAFLALLARFRSTFTEGDQDLRSLINDFSDVQEHDFIRQIAGARILANNIRGEVESPATNDLDRALLLAVDEFEIYEVQALAVIGIRRSAEWNVAQFLFVQEAQPLVEHARSLATGLAEAQALESADKTVMLTRASYGVIVMALAMGFLTGGSLLVSFRLRRQVHGVMAKAKMLGQYEIIRKIGEGGMGQVYLATHAMLRRPTAIKLLKADSVQDLRAQNRLQKEVQLTCQLTHPNTVEVFDYGRTPEGVFYYAMEYLDGFTLEALVDLVGSVPPARIVHILLQICGSLQEAHELGILHRDIKPGNIMLTIRGGEFDTVKVLDFGLVKEFTKDESALEKDPGQLAGTPMFMAPESILYVDAVGPAADVYAIGAVGYFMLAGTTMFEKTTVSEILRKQVGEHPVFPSERLQKELPEDLEYVLMACLAKDPDDRPESAGRLAGLLRACDCGDWSDKDARLWWEQYGESARKVAGGEDQDDSNLRTCLEVAVGASRDGAGTET